MIFINIGIDIGGKHIGMGLVDDDGNIIVREDIYYGDKEIDLDKAFEKINKFIFKYEEQVDNIRHRNTRII